MSLYVEYFTIDKTNGKRCKVKGCGWSKKYCSTTTDMRRHLQNEHPKLFVELEEKQEAIKKKKEENNNFFKLSEPVIPKQDFFKPKTAFSVLSQEKTTELDNTIVDFIAEDLQPFNIIDSPRFRKMISRLNDKYILKSRKYYSNTVLPARYKEIEGMIKKKLATAKYISLTVDEWSSEDLRHCLLSVTARIIGPDFKPYSCTIGAVPLKGKHTGSNMADHLKQFLDDFGIDQKKLTRIVRDGASSMIRTFDLLNIESLLVLPIHCKDAVLFQVVVDGLKVLVDKETPKSQKNVIERVKQFVRKVKTSTVVKQRFEELQDQFDVPQHELQTNMEVVVDGLKVLVDKETPKDQKTVIERVKQFVRKVKTSTVVKQRFEELQEQFDVPQHELQTNVDIRWSSLFLMLTRFREQQRVVIELMVDSSLKMPQFNAEDWNIINSIIEMLQVIAEATKLIQGESISASVIIPIVQVLLQSFTEQINHNHHCKDAISAMKKSLEHRFLDWQTKKHLVLATISDPRFKDCYLPSAFKEVYTDWIVEDFGAPQQIEEEIIPVENMEPHDLYEKFEAVADNSPTRKKETNYCPIKNEIKQYLEQQRYPKTNCVAEYWLQHEKIFPTIAAVYKKYNCSPATSADSERLFSKAKLI
uniref:HAT C-terminal dimerisation domain-containing protein n=1 Tax=Panagrolaimus sp. JU765 TaxID=591449 RepID=A0AC34RME9_9BILA